MYINPDIAITANGYCQDYGFQNEAIHFKFTPGAQALDEIFQTDFVPSNQIKARTTLAPPRYGLADDWWNLSTQSVMGGDFIVPDPQTKEDRELHIAIETNADGTFTVYTTWIKS